VREKRDVLRSLMIPPERIGAIIAEADGLLEPAAISM